VQKLIPILLAAIGISGEAPAEPFSREKQQSTINLTRIHEV